MLARNWFRSLSAASGSTTKAQLPVACCETPAMALMHKLSFVSSLTRGDASPSEAPVKSGETRKRAAQVLCSHPGPHWLLTASTRPKKLRVAEHKTEDESSTFSCTNPNAGSSAFRRSQPTEKGERMPYYCNCSHIGTHIEAIRGTRRDLNLCAAYGMFCDRRARIAAAEPASPAM
jgi:hypothetical protein